MNYANIIHILETIEAKIETATTLSLQGTIYETTEELLEDLNDFIIELEEENKEAIEYIDIHFLSQSTFHIISSNNGWGNAYNEWLQEYEANKS
jgi:hypothetical protein